MKKLFGLAIATIVVLSMAADGAFARRAGSQDNGDQLRSRLQTRDCDLDCPQDCTPDCPQTCTRDCQQNCSQDCDGDPIRDRDRDRDCDQDCDSEAEFWLWLWGCRR